MSLSSVVGLTSPKILKLMGKIDNQSIVVLIDNGTTHNFISNVLIQKMQVPLTETSLYKVVLGTEQATKTWGICKGVVV